MELKKIVFVTFISILFGTLFIQSCSTRYNNSPSSKVATDVNKKEQIKEVELPLVAKSEVTEAKIAMNAPNSPQVNGLCQKVSSSFKRWDWGEDNCEKFAWHHVRNSVNGDPLIWTVIGNENQPLSKKDKQNVTLILCGVHGDEITPIKFCFDILDYLKEGKSDHGEILSQLGNNLVVIAPIVNPDSYFKDRPSRTNYNGVDINRNFPTEDWDKDALRLWRHRYGADKRRYPGKNAMSEPEVIFQVNLIKRYHPDKIITVHAPLTMLDYDGPADRHTGGIIGSRANQLLIQMSEQASSYRIKNYPFFTGSLGNYAGNERNIPTYTLELPSSDPSKSNAYWQTFKGAIHSAIFHDMGKDLSLADGKELKAQDSETNRPN